MESTTNTEQHEMTHIQSLVQSLTPQQMRAIVMRSNGATYQDMSDTMDKPINTIKGWFRKGTVASSVYKEYADMVALEIGNESLQRLKMMVGEATETIYECMMDKDLPSSTRLRTAMYILDKVIPLTLQAQEDKEKALFALMELKGVDMENVIKTPTAFKHFEEVYYKEVSGYL